MKKRIKDCGRKQNKTKQNNTKYIKIFKQMIKSTFL